MTIEQQAQKLEAAQKQIVDLSSERDRALESLQSSQQSLTQLSADGTWVVREGIPVIVRAVLQSEKFGANCGSLQEASCRLGQEMGCSAVWAKYPELLADKPKLFSADGLKELIMERYEKLVNEDYDLVKFASKGDVDLNLLRKKLETDGLIPKP